MVFLGTVLMPGMANADLYSPDLPLFVKETTYFTLIYEEKSREAAAYLAGFADDAYRDIATLLGTESSTACLWS